MAPQDRRNPIDLIARLRAAPHRFRFFQAVRLLALAEGRDALPRRVRFRSQASLAFPASEVLGLAEAGARTEMVVGFLGLTGPAGVLPAHYTELLMERREAHRDGAAHAFLDLFTHRAAALFYAAWRKYRFHLAFEQGERGGFTAWLLALAGLPGSPEESRRSAPDRILALFAGGLAMRPLPASTLLALLGAYFGVPAALEPFVGHWIEAPPAARPRLGAGDCRLGGEAFLGARLWDRQTRIRLRLGPLPLPAFLDFVPGSPGGRALAGLVSACLGHALACDLVLVLEAGAAPAARLPGRASPCPPRLGIDLWLSGSPGERDRDDTRFHLVA